MTKESKKCSKCGEVKGLSFFSPNKTGYLGVRSHCRSCVDTLRCNHYGKKVAPPKPNRMTKESKKCGSCGEVKLLECFYKNKNYADGFKYECKVCVKEYNKKYNQENKEAIAERHKKYNQENKEALAEYFKKYNQENKEALRGYRKKYLQKYPDKNNAKGAKRRARKLNATPPWLTDRHYKDIRNIYAKAIRKSKRDGVKYHVDHVVPLRGKDVSGLHVPWNLQILTAEENLSKSNRYSDWD